MKKKLFGSLAFLSVLAMPFAVDAKTINSDFTLSEDITDGIVLTSGSKATLDLAGHNITNSGEHTIIVEKGATLTIKGKGQVTADTKGKAVLQNNGTLIVKDGTYSRVETPTNGYYVFENHGSATIDGGTFKISSPTITDNGASSLIDNGWQFPEKNTDKTRSTLVINDGNFEITDNNKYIKNDDFGDMTVNGGTFTTDKNSSAVLANIGADANLTVNGGTYNHNGIGKSGNPTEPIWNYAGETTITGGIYHLVSDKVNITDGGTLKVDFNQYTDTETGETYTLREEDLDDFLSIDEVKEDDLDEDVAKLIKEAASKYTIAGFYNIDLFTGLNENTLFEQVLETEDKVTVTLAIPEGLKEVADGYKRIYYVIRVHDGKTEILNTTVNEDGTLSFDTDKFSTYSLVYTDEKVQTNEVVENPNTADPIAFYGMIGAISLAGVAGASVYFKKHQN